MATITYRLSPRQRDWLVKLVNHRNRDSWLSTVKKEKIRIENIINLGFYDAEQRVFLNEIVNYYKDNSHSTYSLDT